MNLVSVQHDDGKTKHYLVISQELAKRWVAISIPSLLQSALGT